MILRNFMFQETFEKSCGRITKVNKTQLFIQRTYSSLRGGREGESQQVGMNHYILIICVHSHLILAKSLRSNVCAHSHIFVLFCSDTEDQPLSVFCLVGKYFTTKPHP